MQVRIHYTLVVKKRRLSFRSDILEAQSALSFLEVLESNKKIEDLMIEDDTGDHYTPKLFRKRLAKVAEEISQLSLYFDANWQDAKQTAGLGVVIYYYKSEKSYRIRKNLMTNLPSSNNEAEYFALFHGLEQLKALDLNPQTIDIYGDSLVVINQLKGEWPVLDQGLNKWADDIEYLLADLKITPTYHAIKREKNKEADRLATTALTGVDVFSTINREGKPK